MASLQILAIMQMTKKKLSQLAGIIDLFPQKLNSVKVNEKKPFEQIPGLLDLIRRYEKELDNKGRINLRYSGTESLARVMVEGQSEMVINNIANEISSFINNQIGE